MDTSDVMSVFLRGVLGSGGRKRARRAARFVSGHRGFLSASTLLGAAGVAWGVYDSLKGSTAAGPSPGSSASSAGPLPVPVPASAVGAAPPPLTPAGIDFEVLRLIRLAVSAAHADGALAPAERAAILQHAREARIEHVVEHELAQRLPLTDIVAGVSDTARRQDLYVLAFTIVRADEQVTGAERIYLAQLAHRLGLDVATVTRLEQETAAKIDAAGDEPAAAQSSTP